MNWQGNILLHRHKWNCYCYSYSDCYSDSYGDCHSSCYCYCPYRCHCHCRIRRINHWVLFLWMQMTVVDHNWKKNGDVRYWSVDIRWNEFRLVYITICAPVQILWMSFVVNRGSISSAMIEPMSTWILSEIEKWNMKNVYHWFGWYNCSWMSRNFEWEASDWDGECWTVNVDCRVSGAACWVLSV
jgi:hypothetical protein